jgi:uncharacterized membrane protein
MAFALNTLNGNQVTDPTPATNEQNEVTVNSTDVEFSAFATVTDNGFDTVDLTDALEDTRLADAAGN